MSGTPRGNGVRRWLQGLREPSITKYAPLAGFSVGALAAAAYWLAAQLWPSSVALILSMLTAALLSDELSLAAAGRGMETLSRLFYVLLKYNVLMALSAAKLPFAAPPNTALCLIMICGYGAARSLQVCLLVSLVSRGPPSRGQPLRTPAARLALSHWDLGVALFLGLSPALLLGMPGLMGMAAAVASIIGLSAAPRGAISFAPWVAEVCFYLGAQASWSYI